MLKKNASLALRAAVVFGLTLAGILLSVLVVNGLLKGGEGDRRGAHFAVGYASSEVQIVNETLTIRPSGEVARLFEENPSMWLIARSGNKTYEMGAVTPIARAAFTRTAGLVETARIRLDGVAIPEAYGVIEEIELSTGTATLGIGGVDPETLPGESGLGLVWRPETLLTLIIISVMSLLAMAVAIPFFTRAVKPITREAALIGPRAPDRRLDEKIAPKELLPLVVGFNAALDTLSAELIRRKRFISDAAHELRTPLAVISLQVDSLPESEERENLRRGLKRLTDLVAQMLDLQRLADRGNGFAPIDLTQLARSVVADLAPMVVSEGYDLALEAPDARVGIIGNSLAVERALTNLIVNAVVHGRHTGQILVEVTADRTITVEDQGPGIDETVQTRLFEPFAQGHQAAGGCGLGLHLTREIMTAHGGRICLLPSTTGAKFKLIFDAAQN